MASTACPLPPPEMREGSAAFRVSLPPGAAAAENAAVEPPPVRLLVLHILSNSSESFVVSSIRKNDTRRRVLASPVPHPRHREGLRSLPQTVRVRALSVMSREAGCRGGAT